MRPARWPRARLTAVTSLVTLALGATGAALAQVEDGPNRTGVRGRVVVAKELLSEATWPMDPERAKDLRGGHRIRRAAGRGAGLPLTEPMPELLLVLEGARPDGEQPRRLVVEGMRFLPAQILAARPGVITVENRQAQGITVVDERGTELATVMPGQSGEVTLEAGEHTLSIREMPFARAAVRVLGPARFLPWTEKGEIPVVNVEAGDYQLAFYHGANALRMQPLTVPDDGFVAIDATVSANGVVTVSIKDGSLRVAVPQAPVKPATPPAPDEEEGEGDE